MAQSVTAGERGWQAEFCSICDGGTKRHLQRFGGERFYVVIRPGGAMRFGSIIVLATVAVAFAAPLRANDITPDRTIPVPEPRPDKTAEPVPVPDAKPVPRETEGDQGLPAKDEAERQEIVPQVKSEVPQAYQSCLAQLKEMGVDFLEKPRIDDGSGCGIEKPLVVQTVLPGIALAPPATMRCETALQLSRWAAESVLPAAKLAFRSELGQIVTFHQATSYACRNRNSAETGKLSEHARGNAIDISGFTFADGSTFTIAPREQDSTLEGAFERAIIAAGCLYFTTVLGPASDKAHETHLHLDVIERKAGYRYCW